MQFSSTRSEEIFQASRAVFLPDQPEVIQRHHDSLRIHNPTEEASEGVSPLMKGCGRPETLSYFRNARLYGMACALLHVTTSVVTAPITGGIRFLSLSSRQNNYSGPQNLVPPGDNASKKSDKAESLYRDMDVMDAAKMNALVSDLSALGRIAAVTTLLPLNLSYPSPRMRSGVLLLLNPLLGRQLLLENELKDC